MAMTPQEEADFELELEAVYEEICNRRRKPKVVTRDDVGTIRDADVRVSSADFNSRDGQARVVQVRRPDFVTVNMAAYDALWEARQADRQAERAASRELDPYRTGLYGPTDFDDD